MTNYTETLTTEEYRGLLLARLRVAAQNLLDVERPGEKVRQIQIDTNTAAELTPNNAQVQEEQEMKYYVMFNSSDGGSWPTSKGQSEFNTLEEAEAAAAQYTPSKYRGFYSVLASSTHPGA
jgi:hypothetical protein